MNYLVKFTDSKVQNIILNMCILLFGINFLYKCNYIIMTTFILLIVFKNFKISFGNVYVLLLLIVYFISWFIFSDGHEISGICLPLCYLIGNNIKNKNETEIIKYVILISISLALYTTLFFVNNIIVNGISSYNVYNQLNIWTGRPLWATNIMLYSSLFNSLFGYIFFVEKDKKIKISYCIVFLINAFYALMLGRRAAVLMIGLSILFSIVYIFISKTEISKKYVLKKLFIISCIFIGIFVILFVSYLFNLFNFKNIIQTTDLFNRFLKGDKITHLFYDMGRSDIRKMFYAYFWQYPWGGSQIHNIIGNYAHDIWLDTYDVAGIITFVLMVAITVIFGIKMIKIITNKKMNFPLRLMIGCLLVCIFAQFCIEPIMEACRAYMFGVCMIVGSIEGI